MKIQNTKRLLFYPLSILPRISQKSNNCPSHCTLLLSSTICLCILSHLYLPRLTESVRIVNLASVRSVNSESTDIATFFEQPLQYGGCISDFQNHCCNLVSKKEVAAAILKIANTTSNLRLCCTSVLGQW